MITRQILAGTIDVSVVIRIIDSTDGTPETGVVYNTSGIDLAYRRELAASVAITEATLAALTTAHADGGFLHIGNGYYRLDLPDAACAAGVTGVLIHGIVTGMVVIGTYVELVAFNPYDAVRLGLTALPNAAAEAAGGLYTRGTGAGQINQTNNGQADANAARLGGTTQTGRDLGTSVLLSSGTGTGQLDFTSGVVKANLAQILGTAITETAGQIAAAFKQFFDVATPTGTMKAITSVVTTTTATNVTTVNGLASGVVTATSIAADAITAAKIADGAIDAATFAAGAINAAAIATDAITAAKIAADAVTEIQAGLATPTNVTAGTITTVTNLTNAPTAGDLTATMKTSVNAEVVDVLRTDTIPDSYATDGTQPTIAQAILAIQQFLMEKSVSGVTVTAKKPDGSTSAMTFTLDSSTSPTSITRAS